MIFRMSTDEYLDEGSFRANQKRASAIKDEVEYYHVNLTLPFWLNFKMFRVSLMLLIDRGNDLGNSLLKYHCGTVQMGIFGYRKIAKDGKNYYPNI